MADPLHKRKFDDPGPAAASRSAGGGAAVSYNRVPPPLSDFESARQRAMEIAARLASQDTAASAAAKRSRFDERSTSSEDAAVAPPAPSSASAAHNNGAANETQYSNQSVHAKNLEKPYNDSSSGSFYSSQGAPESRKVEIPNIKVGLIIGKGGETIKYIQQQSGARVQITKDMEHDPSLPFRTAELMGTPDQINRAEQLIHDVIAEADAAATNPSHPSGGEQIQMNVPTNKVGLIIGRGGETIKSLQSRTGARIQLVPLLGPPEHHSGVPERTLSLVGNKQQLDTATELIKELLSENRTRVPIQGVYSQPYNPQASQQWGGQPMQQPGYGYQQGSYYPAAPQQYGSYPQQPWNQVPAPQFHPPGGYGYYNQQGHMGYTQAQGPSYEQSSLYADQPPGASCQTGYGQPQAYGQNDLSQGYGPPGTSPYIQQSFTNQPPQDSYGPPGIGEPLYGKGTSQQEQNGVVEPYQRGQEPQEQLYGNTSSINSKQNFESSYANISGDGQQVASQSGYGQPSDSATSYWNHNSMTGTAHYGYSETNHEQVPHQSGYGNQQGDSVYNRQEGAASRQENDNLPVKEGSNGYANSHEVASSNDNWPSYEQYGSVYNQRKPGSNDEDAQTSGQTQRQPIGDKES